MANLIHSKEQRYDRQLRLWGDRGQEALENSKICLIGAGAIGSEVLKNLVLPGLGSFTIVDSNLVTKQDLGNNFFTTSSYLGKPRAQAVTELVSELNGDVKGSFMVESMDELLDHDPSFFLNFNAIVYTDIRESPLLRLSRIVSSAHIPIIVCNCVGFVGYLGVSVLEHAIIESHPDSTRPDFRLDNPLPGLTKLANDPENDLEKLPARELVHIPWLIIIHKFVERFRLANNRFPTSYAEKQEVKKAILDAADELLQKCCESGEILEPMFELTNFHEAAKAVNTAIVETKIPDEIAKIFDDCRCVWSMDSDSPATSDELPIKGHQKTSTQSSPIINLSMTSFWKLVSALKEFTFNEGGGYLPLRGDLPDMNSGSDRYLKLLKVYRESADWSVKQLASRLSHVEGLSLHNITVFARNAAFLRVLKSHSLEEELKLSPVRSDDLHLIPTHEENSAMLWYFVLRGVASFVAENNRWPGQPTISSSSNHTDLDMDLPILRQHVNRVLTARGLATNRVCDDYVYEMCRFGGGEIHSIAAFMAGMAAQEVIKLVTHQFVPICQPLIYNGITQQTEILQF